MEIAIVGAGAVGSSLGALLARKGHDVLLIGRAAHASAMQRDGLQVGGYLGQFIVPVRADVGLHGPVDLVCLTTKTQDLEAAIQQNYPHLAGTPVVTFQNGLCADETATRLLGSERVVGAVVFIHAVFVTPGRVDICFPGSLVLGRPHGPSDGLVHRVANVLGDAVSVRTTDNLVGARWLKLIVNLNNALPAITNLSMGQVYDEPYLCRLAVRLMREGLAVAGRSGIRLESLPDVSVMTARLASILPEALFTRVAARKARQMEKPGPMLGSTLQSIRRGRPTEVDYLNGEIVRRGTAVGVPTPLNAAVVELVHQIESTGRFLGPSEVSEAIGRINATKAQPRVTG